MLSAAELDALEKPGAVELDTSDTARPHESRAASGLGAGGFASVDESSGCYTVSIPIDLPVAMAEGPAPQLTLQYSSQNSEQPSLIAAGWRLELGSIERRARLGASVDFRNAQGVNPQAGDHFVLTVDGRSCTLVNMLGHPHLFRAKVEQSYIEAERVLSTHRDPDSGELEIDHWRVYLANGIRYVFGTPGGSGQAACGGTLRNKLWRITAIEDVRGFAVRYDYALYDHAAQNPDWAELPYAYPDRIRCGVDPDGASWDSEVRFHWRADDVPDPHNGYYNLGRSFTGRRYPGADKEGYACILWRRLERIEIWFRDVDGQFRCGRQWRLHSERQERIRWLRQVELVGCSAGEPDPEASLPPHRFSYSRGPKGNPALLTVQEHPLGRREEVEYLPVAQADEGQAPNKPEHLMVVRRLTATDGSERRSRSFRYWNGLFFRAFGEYRGFERIESRDEVTGQRTVSVYEQNGVHAHQLRTQQRFDCAGILSTETRSQWMALDYHGGRFLAFQSRQVQRSFDESGLPLSTRVSAIAEVPAHEHAWGFAIDAYGNIEEQIESTYAGGEEAPQHLLQQVRIVSQYRHFSAPGRRLLGLIARTQRWMRTHVADPWTLIEHVDNDHDPDTGSLVASHKRLDRDDPSLVVHKRIEYHPTHGKQTRILLVDDHGERVERQFWYYEDGPYKYLQQREVNALGQGAQVLAYDLGVRAASHVREANGSESLVQYDGLGRTVSEIFTAVAVTHADAAGRTSVRHRYRIAAGERWIETRNLHTDAWERREFDAWERLVRTLSSHPQGRVVEVRTRYDVRSLQPAAVSEPCFVGTPAPAQTLYRYDDPRLRQTATVTPTGLESRTRYQGLLTVHESDVRDAQGQHLHLLTQETEVDALGREVRRSEGSSVQTRYEVRYHRDALGRLQRVTDSLGRTLQTLVYGSRMDDLPARLEDLARGNSEMRCGPTGKTLEIRRDQQGVLDRLCQFRYDPLDRLVWQQETSGLADLAAQRTVEIAYDQSGNGIGLKSRIHLVEQAADGAYQHEQRYRYDAFGQLAAYAATLQVQLSGHTHQIALEKRCTFNGHKDGRLQSVHLPRWSGLGGGRVDYTYDDASGLLLAVSYDGAPIWQADPDAIDARGAATRVELGNGTQTRCTYDPRDGRLVAFEARRGTTVLMDSRLEYDNARNLRSRRLALMDLAIDGRETAPDLKTGRFVYDDKHQLLAVGGDEGRQRFVYRADGSRLTWEREQGTVSYQYSDRCPHRITGLAGAIQRQLQYDAAGNLRMDLDAHTQAVRTMAWNASNRVQTLTVAQHGQAVRQLRYGYDAQHTRLFLLDTIRATLTYYFDDDFELEIHADGRCLVRTHIQNGARRIATVEEDSLGGKRWWYYYRDHLQSVGLLADARGHVIRRSRYSAFGSEHDARGNNPAGIGFGGHRPDLEQCQGFSNIDFGARHYDPELGIFLAADPKDDVGNVAFGFNRYCYVGNNPLSAIDPDGREVDKDNLEFTAIYVDARTQLMDSQGSMAGNMQKALGHAPALVNPNSVPKSSNLVILLDEKNRNAHTLATASHCITASGANQSTIISCNMADKDQQTIAANLKANGTSLEKLNTCPAGRQVGPDLITEVNGETLKQPKYGIIHEKLDGTDQRLVDLRASDSYTDIPVKTDRSQQALRFGIPGSDSSFTTSTLKVLGKGMKVLDIGQTVVSVGTKNVAETASDGIDAGLGTAAMALAGLPGAIAYGVGYGIGTAIHKLTGGYVANKMADGLSALGVGTALASADAARKSVVQWFKSWW